MGKLNKKSQRSDARIAQGDKCVCLLLQSREVKPMKLDVIEGSFVKRVIRQKRSLSNLAIHLSDSNHLNYHLFFPYFVTTHTGSRMFTLFKVS